METVDRWAPTPGTAGFGGVDPPATRRAREARDGGRSDGRAAVMAGGHGMNVARLVWMPTGHRGTGRPAGAPPGGPKVGPPCRGVRGWPVGQGGDGRGWRPGRRGRGDLRTAATGEARLGERHGRNGVEAAEMRVTAWARRSGHGGAGGGTKWWRRAGRATSARARGPDNGDGGRRGVRVPGAERRAADTRASGGRGPARGLDGRVATGGWPASERRVVSALALAARVQAMAGGHGQLRVTGARPAEATDNGVRRSESPCGRDAMEQAGRPGRPWRATSRRREARAAGGRADHGQAKGGVMTSRGRATLPAVMETRFPLGRHGCSMADGEA